MLGCCSSRVATTEIQESAAGQKNGECMLPKVSSVSEHLFKSNKNFRTLADGLYPDNNPSEYSFLLWINIKWINDTNSEHNEVLNTHPTFSFDCHCPSIHITIHLSVDDCNCVCVGALQVCESWIWSMSCLYVLMPLEFFPLVSVWVFNPERRTREIEIELPPFCSGTLTEDANSAIYLTLRQLESFVHNRESPDPNNNKAQCVVGCGNYGDYANIRMDKALMLLCLNVSASLLFFLAIVCLLVQYGVDYRSGRWNEVEESKRGAGYYTVKMSARGRPLSEDSGWHRETHEGIHYDGDSVINEDYYEREKQMNKNSIDEDDLSAVQRGEILFVKKGMEKVRDKMEWVKRKVSFISDELKMKRRIDIEKVKRKIKILGSDLYMLEKDMKMLEEEMSIMEEELRLREMKYSVFMTKKEMWATKKELWAIEKEIRELSEEMRKKKSKKRIWDQYLKILVESLWFCDLLCLFFLAFLVHFYMQLLHVVTWSWVIPLMLLDSCCFAWWTLDFAIRRVGQLFCCICCCGLCDFIRIRSSASYEEIGCERNSHRLAFESASDIPEESQNRNVNLLVYVPIVVSFLLHSVVFAQWITLVTLFDFSYGLEILCVIGIVVFHIFTSIKISLKLISKAKEQFSKGNEEFHFLGRGRFCSSILRGSVWFVMMIIFAVAGLITVLVWLYVGYHTFAKQSAGLQVILTLISIGILFLERKAMNLDMTTRGYLRSLPRAFARLSIRDSSP